MMKKILALLLLISLFATSSAHATGGISGRPVTINPLSTSTLFLCLNDNIGTGDDQQCSGTQLESLLWASPTITGALTTPAVRYSSGGGFAGDATSGHIFVGQVYSNTSNAYQSWLFWQNGTTPAVVLAPPADGTLAVGATNVSSGLFQMSNAASLRPFGTTAGNNYFFGVYDNTSAAYVPFLTATNGTGSTVSMAAPTNGTLAINATTLAQGGVQVATLSGSETLTNKTLGTTAFTNGDGLQGDTTTGHVWGANVYDNTGSAQRTWLTVTNGTAPNVNISVPTNGTTTIAASSLTSALLDLTNGGAIHSSTTTAGNTWLLGVYDNTGSAFRAWMTATNGTTPTVAINNPTNGTLTLNKYTFTAPATAATLTIANNKTLTANNTLTFTGTDSSSVAFGAGGTVLYNGGALGTPSSGTATNLSGTASALTAGNVTTNANLTGPVTSVGNATTISANAVSLSMLATQATNTVLANATSGSAVPTALTVGSCSTAGSALIWTTNSGFSCNTSITAASATGNAGTATALATGRTIAITGDIAYTSPSFDGSSNVTAAGTLATVNSNVGTFGSATQSNTITANGKGLITAISSQTVTPAVGSITGLGTGVATWAATPSSANFFSAITDETGSGAVVGGTSPTITGLIDLPTISSKAGSYTFGLTDGGGYVRFSSTANLTATIPANATTAFPVGTQIPFSMWNTGTLTVAGAAGVTLTYSALTYTSSGGYAIKTGTNTWDVIGGH